MSESDIRTLSVLFAAIAATIALIIAVLFITGVTPWALIVIYWCMVTIKNSIDWAIAVKRRGGNK